MKKYLFYGLLTYYIVLNYFTPGEVERFSLLYFLLTIPVLVFLGFFWPYWTRRYKRATVVLAAMLSIILIISFVRLDWRTLQSAFLLFCTLIVLINAEIELDTKIINHLFLLCILGSVISYHAGINPYGYLPNIDAMKEIISGNVGLRISLFPLIPESAFFSLFVLVCNYYFNKSRSRFLFYFLAGYFLVFSSSRTAMAILFFFVAFEFMVPYLRFRRRPFYAWLNLVFIISFILILDFKSIYLYISQIDSEIVRTLLLREQVNSVSESSNIGDIATRLWIWKQHISIFLSNPLFGVGTYDFGDFVTEKTKVYHFTTGSESFFTAWLARVGVSMMLLVFSFALIQHDAMRKEDRFRYFMTFMFFMIMISYGSFVVPYNFMFLLLGASLAARSMDTSRENIQDSV